MDFDDYHTDLQWPSGSSKHKGKAVSQEFDYKTWVRKLVDITDEMRVAARTSMLAFRWRYYIGGSNLEFYDDVNLNRVPKADKNIKICSSYLDYGLRLPFSLFVTMVLNYFQ